MHQIPLTQGQIRLQTFLLAFLLYHAPEECKADGGVQPGFRLLRESAESQLPSVEEWGRPFSLPRLLPQPL
eukprot:jgi/Botrbrau1/17420/Bobra.0054s0016.1